MNFGLKTTHYLLRISLILLFSHATQVMAGSFPMPMGENNNTYELSNALFGACSFGSTDFDNDCQNALFEADLDNEVLNTLTPDEIIANNTNITSGSVNANFTRLANIRTMGTGSSADAMFGALSVYTNGHSTWQDYKAQGLNPGFRYFDSKATLGADYRFSDTFVAGLSSSYLNSDSRINKNAGSSDSDGYSFSAYGSFYLLESFYIDGSFTYSDHTHDTKRNVIYTGSNQIASAKVDSDTYSAGVNAGYNFYFGSWTITPTARWMYRNIQMDAYTESFSDPTGPGGTLALAISEQEYESITGNFGAQISYALSLPWGVLVPTVSGEFVHEFSNNPKQINARFVNAPSGTGAFTVNTTAMDKDYATVTAGMSAQFAKGVSAFLNYEKILGLKHLTSDSISMGIRLDLQ